MELWIRSQNKRILQKINSVYLNANYENKRICTDDSNDDAIELGEYASKERALEVLDEIQNILMPKIIVKQAPIDDLKIEYTIREVQNLEYDIEQLDTYVYEMPEE